MSSSDSVPKPKWWQLYLTFPCLLGMFLLDTRLHLSTGGHETIQLGSVFMEFVLVQVWLRLNARALRHMDNEVPGRTFRIIEMPPATPPVEPIEIKGVLGDTFEMDYVDADSYPSEATTDQVGTEPK
jgi:hypothetical protein